MVKRQAFWRGGWLLSACSAAVLMAAAAAVAAPSHGERSTVVVRVDGGFHWLGARLGAGAAPPRVVFGHRVPPRVGGPKGRRGKRRGHQAPRGGGGTKR